ncbi:hypothetical protein TUMEXPCC7403_01640 [Tumidithrix helvetica PCC 7403]|uniref:hypothetical protein n=1 Tax=Tumidithrix helvetica TaxID=3457545 RepID=UPI003C8475AE
MSKPKPFNWLQEPTQPPTVGDWVFLATLNENLLDKEHNLTNHRMAWMMSTQAFLFSTFCIILINSPKEQRTAAMLLNLIPGFALVIAVTAIIGIFAAQSVIDVLEKERSIYHKILKFLFDHSDMPDIGYERSGGLSWTRFGGVWPPRIISIGIAILWLLVLLGRFGLIDRGL